MKPQERPHGIFSCISCVSCVSWSDFHCSLCLPREWWFILVTPFYGVTRSVALYALMAWKEAMDSTVLRILPLVVFQP